MLLGKKNCAEQLIFCKVQATQVVGSSVTCISGLYVYVLHGNAQHGPILFLSLHLKLQLHKDMEKRLWNHAEIK